MIKYLGSIETMYLSEQWKSTKFQDYIHLTTLFIYSNYQDYTDIISATKLSTVGIYLLGNNATLVHKLWSVFIQDKSNYPHDIYHVLTNQCTVYNSFNGSSQAKPIVWRPLHIYLSVYTHLVMRLINLFIVINTGQFHCNWLCIQTHFLNKNLQLLTLI